MIVDVVIGLWENKINNNNLSLLWIYNNTFVQTAKLNSINRIEENTLILNKSFSVLDSVISTDHSVNFIPSDIFV